MLPFLGKTKGIRKTISHAHKHTLSSLSSLLTMAKAAKEQENMLNQLHSYKKRRNHKTEWWSQVQESCEEQSGPQWKQYGQLQGLGNEVQCLNWLIGQSQVISNNSQQQNLKEYLKQNECTELINTNQYQSYFAC